MNPHWRSFLESAEAIFDGNTNELLSFGEPAGELQAGKQQTGRGIHHGEASIHCGGGTGAVAEAGASSPARPVGTPV